MSSSYGVRVLARRRVSSAARSPSVIYCKRSGTRSTGPIAEGHATRTPFKSAQGVNVITIKASKGRSRRLEAGEADTILDVASDYIKDFFNAMIETGCRPGELRTLQWSEVRGDEIIILAPKAKDREERRIPIMPTLAKIIGRRKVGPDGQELAPDRSVFGNEVGEPVARRRLCTW